MAETYAKEMHTNLDEVQRRMPDDPSVIPDFLIKVAGHTAKALKVSKGRTLYLTRDVIRDGFKGEVDGYRNAVTLTLVHPKASLEDIRDSLHVILQDIEIRMRMREKKNG